MRLSELTTDESLDALCVLTPYINNIVIDQDLTEELRRKVNPDNLKNHRLDVYGILSVLNGKTPQEIGKQNFLVTAKQIRDVVKDKELLDFFRSCAEQEKNAS